MKLKMGYHCSAKHKDIMLATALIGKVSRFLSKKLVI